MRANRHAGCMIQRRVLREPSQHVTRLIENLQTVITVEEADCQPGYGLRRISLRHRRFDHSNAIHSLPNTSFAYCAAQFLGGFFLGGTGGHMTRKGISGLLFVLVMSACANGPPKLPYPAFVQVDDLDDIFMASLPGVRAKQLAGDPQTRRTSNRIDLPPDWNGTSGGTPGRSLEIFVIAGQLTIADIDLGRGGYAFLPAGSLGFNLRSDEGARILYFLNDVDPESIIRSPIIIDTGLLKWEAAASLGVFTKELRMDPGNGAMTWLLRIEPGATMPWQKSSAVREGYLVDGSYQHSECVGGKVHTWQYAAGGYFYRPADTINGGPDSSALLDSVWLLREPGAGTQETVPACTGP